MVVGKYEIYFIQDICTCTLGVSKANEGDILPNTIYKFHISKHPCTVLFIIVHK